MLYVDRKNRMRPASAYVLTLFLLAGCAAVVPATPIPSPPRQALASPTSIQLPFNPEVRSDKFCQPPSAILPVSEGDDITEEEIVHDLVRLWLRRYASTDAPLFCRIEDYRIDNVYYDADVISKTLEPRGDFMRVVRFSVKLIQVPSAWMSFPGELDQDNWLHIGQVAAVFKTAGGYALEFAHP